MIRSKLLGKFKLKGVHRDMGADDPARLEELEAALGKRLPKDYRVFVLELAPSHFSRYVCFRALEPNPWAHNGLNEIGVFYGLDKGSSYDLIRNYEMDRSDLIPTNTITIATDSGANNTVLAFDEPPGRVYFQDKITRKLYLCANSFTEFLNSLEIDHDNDDSEEEEEIDEEEET